LGIGILRLVWHLGKIGLVKLPISNSKEPKFGLGNQGIGAFQERGYYFGNPWLKRRKVDYLFGEELFLLFKTLLEDQNFQKVLIKGFGRR